MKEIIDILTKLEKGQYKADSPDLQLTFWRPQKGISKFPLSNLDNLEKEHGIQLPDDYKSLMLKFGIFHLESAKPDKYREIQFFTHNGSRESSTHFLNNQIEQKPIFSFASDGGGNEYFYDVSNTAGKGYFAVFCGYPGRPYWKDCYFESNSLSEMLNDFLAGNY